MPSERHHPTVWDTLRQIGTVSCEIWADYADSARLRRRYERQLRRHRARAWPRWCTDNLLMAVLALVVLATAGLAADLWPVLMALLERAPWGLR